MLRENGKVPDPQLGAAKAASEGVSGTLSLSFGVAFMPGGLMDLLPEQGSIVIFLSFQVFDLYVQK